MSSGYQESDKAIIDYQLWHAPGIRRAIRGPAPDSLSPGSFVAFAGAAQTFGRYCPEPYPAQLQRATGLTSLNLGVAGAGPAFFLRKEFLYYINRSRALVLQVLSARSVANSLFDTVNAGEMLRRRSDGVVLGALPMYKECHARIPRQELQMLVEETRRNWVMEYEQLLSRITVPTILVWFSTRRPDYQEDYASVQGVFGAFPQMVNQSMLDALRDKVSCYVEYVSDCGLPQPLLDRETQERVSVAMRSDLGGRHKRANDYYPSPEMHAGLADKLAPLLRGLVDVGPEYFATRR